MPATCKAFVQCAIKVFISFICSQVVNIQKVNVVWDRHFQDILKSEGRNNGGAGVYKKTSVMEK